MANQADKGLHRDYDKYDYPIHKGDPYADDFQYNHDSIGVDESMVEKVANQRRRQSGAPLPPNDKEI